MKKTTHKSESERKNTEFLNFLESKEKQRFFNNKIDIKNYKKIDIVENWKDYLKELKKTKSVYIGCFRDRWSYYPGLRYFYVEK